MRMPLTGDDLITYEIICPCGKDTTDDAHLLQQVLPPFCDDAVSFVDAFSKHLFNTPVLKKYPELMALAFWMRRGRIEKFKKDFEQLYGDRVLLGRGTVFHIAPANVDTLFVYSWFLSLLVGNINIVRLSSTTNPQLTVLIDVLNTLLEQEHFTSIRKRTLLIRYGHDDDVTSYFSSQCDIRVIWGGDSTIQHIRTIPIPPTAVEIPFADKFSLAVINADAFNQDSEQQKIIEKFYNDSYWFGQMACSSPRLLVWVGNTAAVCRAGESFWSLLEAKTLQASPDLSAADVMNKVVTSSMMAIDHPQVKLIRDEHGFIHRVQVQSLDDVDEHKHCGGGLFFETGINGLGELTSYISSRNQTITSFGFTQNDWLNWLKSSRPGGIDRIVPIGQALDFSVVWDGVDLLRNLCREISIEV